MSKKVAKKAAKAEPQAKNTAKNKGSRKAAPDSVAQDKPSPGSRKSRPAPIEHPAEAVEESSGSARNSAAKRRVTVTIDASAKEKGETSAAKGPSKKRPPTARKTAETISSETPSKISSGDEATNEAVGFANSPFAADLDESVDELARSKTRKSGKAAKKAGTAAGATQGASETAAQSSESKARREKSRKNRPVDAAEAPVAKTGAASEVNEARQSTDGETKTDGRNHSDARRSKKASRTKGQPVPTPEVDVDEVRAADSQGGEAPEIDPAPSRKRKATGATPPATKGQRRKHAAEAQATEAEPSVPVEEAVIDPAAEEALTLERELGPKDGASPDPDASEDDDEEDEAAILGLGEETREEDDEEELTEEEENQRYLKGIIEALLFASDKPLTGRELARAARIDKKRTVQLLAELRKEYRHRGVNIVEVSGGFVLRSNPAYGAFVQKALALRPVKLSRAQLETLAIVAYRQPITRPEIDDIRGVDSGQVLKGLADRDLIKMVGKKDEAGRPMLYGTTDAFLELFSLESLKGLPNLREFTELSDDSREKFAAVTGETIPGPTVLSEDGAGSDEDSQSAEAGAEGALEDTSPLGLEEEDGAVETDGEAAGLDSDLRETHPEASPVDDVDPVADEDADKNEPLDSALSSELLEDAAPIAELDDVESPTWETRPESVEVPREQEPDSSPNAAPYFDEGDDVADELVDDSDELR